MPPSATNLADDAAFLAAAYGLCPDPWQGEILRGWLGRRPDRKWSASRAGLAVPRQNGKNAALEIRELFGMVDLGERFLHTAHEVKTARKAFIRLLEFFDNPRFPELRDLTKEIRRTNGQEAILLTNGGGVEFVARTKGSGRGFTVDVLVLDEAQELSDDTYAALLPTISSAPLGNPQQILTGTPPGPGVSGEVFTRTRDTAISGEGARLCWLEWSCEKGANLDDVTEWARSNPALGLRDNAIGFEAIVDEREAMDEATFARERCGMWDIGGVRHVIDPDVWSALTDRASQSGEPMAFAVDVTPDRSSSSIAVAGPRDDGCRHVEVVENQPGTGWVTDRVAELVDRWGGDVVLDASGPAGSLIADLKSKGVEPVVVSAREMGQACGGFFDAVQDGTLRHLGQATLNSALAAARKRSLGDAWAWHRKDSSVDISPLVAVTLALFGHQRAATAKPKRTGVVW